LVVKSWLKVSSFRKIEDNKIKNYNELERSSDYIIQLTERKQKPEESLSQFYTAVSDLATIAYPDTPRQTEEQFTTKQFILGLNNKTRVLLRILL
jgi:hypothetical protein